MMMNSPVMSTFSPALARMHVGMPCTPAVHYLGFGGSLPFAPLPAYLTQPAGGSRDFFPRPPSCPDYARAQSQFSVDGILGKHGLGNDKDNTSINGDRDVKLAGKTLVLIAYYYCTYFRIYTKYTLNIH